MSLLVTAPTVEKTSQKPKSTQLAPTVGKTQKNTHLSIIEIRTVLGMRIKTYTSTGVVVTETIFVDKKLWITNNTRINPTTKENY